MNKVGVGSRFGRLVVEQMYSERMLACKKVRRDWLCVCDCGSSKIVQTQNLLKGDTSSCGCLQKEGVRERSIKHNASYSPTYMSWSAMKARCGNVRHTAYKNYGGRGISVCARWQASFENFLADMGARPSELYSIDRIDENGNYEPGNCRWVLKKDQGLNRRATLKVTYRDEDMSFRAAVLAAGLVLPTAKKRLREGVPIEQIIPGAVLATQRIA